MKPLELWAVEEKVSVNECLPFQKQSGSLVEATRLEMKSR